MIEKNPELQKGMRALYIVWGFLFFSVFVYLLAAWMIVQSDLTQPFLDDLTLSYARIVLYVLTPCNIILAVFLKRKMFFFKNENIERRLAEKRMNILAGLQKYAVSMLVVWVLADAIGIYGLVLFMLGKSAIDLHVLVCIAIAMFYVLRPRQSEVLYLAKMVDKPAAAVE